MDRRRDLPPGWRQPPETTAEPVPLRRPYLGRFLPHPNQAPQPRPRSSPRSRFSPRSRPYRAGTGTPDRRRPFLRRSGGWRPCGGGGQCARLSATRSGRRCCGASPAAASSATLPPTRLARGACAPGRSRRAGGTMRSDGSPARAARSVTLAFWVGPPPRAARSAWTARLGLGCLAGIRQRAWPVVTRQRRGIRGERAGTSSGWQPAGGRVAARGGTGQGRPGHRARAHLRCDRRGDVRPAGQRVQQRHHREPGPARPAPVGERHGALATSSGLAPAVAYAAALRAGCIRGPGGADGRPGSLRVWPRDDLRP